MGAKWALMALYTICQANAYYVQLGKKLVGTGGLGQQDQGVVVRLNDNGDTLASGARGDNASRGAVWIFYFNGTIWAQQGAKIVGTGATGAAYQGSAVALSSDGGTLASGGPTDDSTIGAVWVFIRFATSWTQQGPKLVGTGNVGASSQGSSVALSSDGNILASGGYSDDNYLGAVWIFIRTSNIWSQKGEKLVGTGAIGNSNQGSRVALNSAGDTLVSSGVSDNSNIGAVWIYSFNGTGWAQQGPKLVGTNVIGVAGQGRGLALSSDGNTLAIGGPYDNSSAGAVWIFTRSGSTWSQQGDKLLGGGAFGNEGQGGSVALSSTGDLLAIGCYSSFNYRGAVWVFTRTETTWSQLAANLTGNDATYQASQAFSVSLSFSGYTIASGAPTDNGIGAVTIFQWVFPSTVSPTLNNATASPSSSNITTSNPPSIPTVINQMDDTTSIIVGSIVGIFGLIMLVMAIMFRKKLFRHCSERMANENQGVEYTKGNSAMNQNTIVSATSKRSINLSHFVFISYAKIDALAETKIVAEFLATKFPGRSVFRDTDQHFTLSTLVDNVSRTSNMLVFLTPNYIRRPYCLIEANCALRHNINIVTVMIRKPGLAMFDFDAVRKAIESDISMKEYEESEMWKVMNDNGLTVADVRADLAKIIDIKAFVFDVDAPKRVQDAQLETICEVLLS
jgi:hypothetical protein